MITVAELIAELQALPQDYIVILQKDGEGNDYSPLAGVDGDNQVYEPESTYSGYVKSKQLTPGNIGTGKNCVVLFPIN